MCIIIIIIIIIIMITIIIIIIAYIYNAPNDALSADKKYIFLTLKQNGKNVQRGDEGVLALNVTAVTTIARSRRWIFTVMHEHWKAPIVM